MSPKPTNPNPNDPKATPKKTSPKASPKKPRPKAKSTDLGKAIPFNLKEFDETPDESWSETKLNRYAKHHHNQFRQTARKAAIHVYLLGAALTQIQIKLKTKLKTIYGHWGPTLKKLGISVPTAWRAMKLFELATEQQVEKLGIVAAYEKYGLSDSKKMPSGETDETEQSPASAMQPATRTIPTVIDAELVIETDTATDILADMSILNDWTTEQQSYLVKNFLDTSAPAAQYGDTTREMLAAIDSSGSLPAFRAFLESQLMPTNGTTKPKIFIPTSSEESIISTDEFDAVTFFVSSVGGWQRAETVFLHAKKQWEENRANQ